MRTIAIANQKGGVGKTTTAINLGAALAALEKPVLLVDCDAQGNAGRGLGLEARAPTLYEVLIGNAGIEETIRPTALECLEAVPAGRTLVGAEVEFVGLEGWQSRLRASLAPVVDRYDTILLDCPPSLGHLTINALAAADGVLVPLQCEYFALEGIKELLNTIRRVQTGLNPQLTIAGILLTMYDERTNLARDVARDVRTHFADVVFDTIVPRNVRLAEAPSHGLSVLSYDIRSRGAQAYLALAREMLSRLS
ncbi:MAG: ParA family protein [Thermoanaerobaculia bacterium]